MNGHLVVRAAQTTRHTAHARLVVHVRFHHVVVGTKGAFEAFGQFGFAFGNDLVWKCLGGSGENYVLPVVHEYDQTWATHTVAPRMSRTGSTFVSESVLYYYLPELSWHVVPWCDGCNDILGVGEVSSVCVMQCICNIYLYAIRIYILLSTLQVQRLCARCCCYRWPSLGSYPELIPYELRSDDTESSETTNIRYSEYR